MRKKITPLKGIAAALIFCGCIGNVALRHSRMQVHRTVNLALQEAEDVHYCERLAAFQQDSHRSVDPAIKAYLSKPTSPRKVKSYTLQTAEGKTTYLFKDSLSEEKARKLLNEYLLADMQPLNVERVNRYFQERLEEKGISGMAGVLYTDKERNTRKRAGILPVESAYKTPVIRLDLTRNLLLQGWADYDLFTLCRFVHWGFYGLLCVPLATAGVFAFVRRRKGPQRPEKGLFIDLPRRTLLINGLQCAISPLDLQLLSLLCEKKGACVNEEELKAACWPHDAQADEKLAAHIQTIRKVLQDFPDYRIVTVKGRGYCLWSSLTVHPPRHSD